MTSTNQSIKTKLWLRIITLALGGMALTLTAQAADQITRDYAAQCNAAIGLPVPEFDCNDPNFTDVPVNHLSANGATCDEPNRLNRACDPGSRFRVFKSPLDAFGVSRAFVVVHCRKKGQPGNTFGDIAAIQHNIISGATCFYQEGPNNALAAHVTAPTQPTGNQWNAMDGNGATGCMSCHDNGPIIRTPYFAQVPSNAKNLLPGISDNHFNSVHSPYFLVGNTSVKGLSVTVPGNVCNDCHRMGMTTASGGGTARDFGLRAVQAHFDRPAGIPIDSAPETSKNMPNSPSSPVWMPPGHIDIDAVSQQSARDIAHCATKIADPNFTGAVPAGCAAARYDFPFGPDVCAQGFVWREAYEFDHVCVPPPTRSKAWADNAQANARRAPNGGPFGPDTCKQGFVWREANKNNPLNVPANGHVDHVCVVPPTRSQAAQDNQLALGRRQSPLPQ